jgi:type I restriction enzyme M protein
LLPKTRESIKVYRDVGGLCKIATLDEIEAQGWSLNPGRYVGVAQGQEPEDFDESRTIGRVE